MKIEFGFSLPKTYDSIAMEYIKRIGRFAKIGRINKEHVQIVFCTGKRCENIMEIDSVELAKLISSFAMRGVSSLKIDLDTVSNRENSYNVRLITENVSIGDDLKKILVLEQTYRAFMIINNRAYHK